MHIKLEIKSMNFEFHENDKLYLPKFSKIFMIDRIKDKDVKIISSFNRLKNNVKKKNLW